MSALAKPSGSVDPTTPAREPPPARDWAVEAEGRLLGAMLERAPALGWTWRAAYAAGTACGFSRGDVDLIAPGGPADLAALWSRACDRAAIAALARVDPATLKIRARIRAGALARIAAAMEAEAATRQWTGFLALPTHAPLALRLCWESADAIWRWAGDTATDSNHYSKRALLGGILAGALAVRLTRDEAAAEAHVDSRIARVMAFERLKGRIGRLELGRRVAEAAGRLRFGALGR